MFYAVWPWIRYVCCRIPTVASTRLQVGVEAAPPPVVNRPFAGFLDLSKGLCPDLHRAAGSKPAGKFRMGRPSPHVKVGTKNRTKLAEASSCTRTNPIGLHETTLPSVLGILYYFNTSTPPTPPFQGGENNSTNFPTAPLKEL